jgi:hypothetical protein
VCSLCSYSAPNPDLIITNTTPDNKGITTTISPKRWTPAQLAAYLGGEAGAWTARRGVGGRAFMRMGEEELGRLGCVFFYIPINCFLSLFFLDLPNLPFIHSFLHPLHLDLPLFPAFSSFPAFPMLLFFFPLASRTRNRNPSVVRKPRALDPTRCPVVVHPYGVGGTSF